MKRLLLLFIILFSFIGSAQENFRLNDAQKNKIKKINTEVLNSILWVEHRLEKNNTKAPEEIFDPAISTITQSYKSQNLSVKQISTLNEIVCLKCYENEWKYQEDTKNLFFKEKKILQDSINQVKDRKIREKIVFEKEQERLKIARIDSINKNRIDDTPPYTKLERSLRAFSSNRDLTVFRNIDHTFATMRFSSYLQMNMGLASKDFKITETKIIEKFIPKVSKDDDYLKVVYNIINKKNIEGAFGSDNVPIIQSVEISGTPDLIINLFLNYWPGNVKLGGFKKGEIASKQLLGDYVVLEGISVSLYKIKIIKGNMDVNYETTYGINKPK